MLINAKICDLTSESISLMTESPPRIIHNTSGLPQRYHYQTLVHITIIITIISTAAQSVVVHRLVSSIDVYSRKWTLLALNKFCFLSTLSSPDSRHPHHHRYPRPRAALRLLPWTWTPFRVMCLPWWSKSVDIGSCVYFPHWSEPRQNGADLWRRRGCKSNIGFRFKKAKRVHFQSQ